MFERSCIARSSNQRYSGSIRWLPTHFRPSCGQEEYIWFGQVNKSVTDVKHLTDRYKDWLASQHLEHKYEQIGDATIQLVKEINATSDATTEKNKLVSIH